MPHGSISFSAAGRWSQAVSGIRTRPSGPQCCWRVGDRNLSRPCHRPPTRGRSPLIDCQRRGFSGHGLSGPPAGRLGAPPPSRFLFHVESSSNLKKFRSFRPGRLRPIPPAHGTERFGWDRHRDSPCGIITRAGISCSRRRRRRRGPGPRGLSQKNRPGSKRPSRGQVLKTGRQKRKTAGDSTKTS